MRTNLSCLVFYKYLYYEEPAIWFYERGHVTSPLLFPRFHCHEFQDGSAQAGALLSHVIGLVQSEATPCKTTYSEAVMFKLTTVVLILLQHFSLLTNTRNKKYLTHFFTKYIILLSLTNFLLYNLKLTNIVIDKIKLGLII